ncbi:hypothetical protein COV20_02990 [Candidatus Woesearchaeota archaeon CG10_big_fil_rev_8_21_14_0_10_45_16]|nr:MAG: hypothetical protein COV20_02990 [Candidatus Woesearchaeota archaeon CG10_big_fil_rev_8_21_14_0_10_45_16]
MARIILLTTPSNDYLSTVRSFIKKNLGSKLLIYVTVNRTYSDLQAAFGKELKAKNSFFIDCVSKVNEVTKKGEDNCLFLGSPREITGLSLAITKSVDAFPGKKVLVIDSISTLSAYNGENIVARFSHFMIGKMRLKDVDTVLIVIDSGVANSLRGLLESFVDEVI